jgi:urease subunit alpha
VWTPLGSGSGSTRLGEPLVQGALWGGTGDAPAHLATMFSAATGAERARAAWGGPVALVRGTRTVRKADLPRNGATPAVEVDGERREVRIDGEPVRLEPAAELPLNRAYFLT